MVCRRGNDSGKACALASRPGSREEGIGRESGGSREGVEGDVEGRDTVVELV